MSSTASNSDSPVPLIALTAGEPAGIGPDLVIAAAQQRLTARLLVFADPAMLNERAAQLGVKTRIVETAAAETPVHSPGQLQVCPVRLARRTTAGRLDPANAAAVLESIRQAAEITLDGRAGAMVTGPVNKAHLNRSASPFTGHTKYIGELCGARPVMMLMSQALRVVLVTTHLPLSQVSAALTAEQLEHAITVADADLRARFGIDRPSLLVCGLNPHAGEDGTLGDEEQKVIAPVLDRLRARGMDLTGPVAADTAFTSESLRGRDAVIAMYHDQGLAPLKALGFGSIVNVTLGLPIIRTSVDHGTALPLAGTGRARPDSMLAAIELAIKMARQARERRGISNTVNAPTPA